MELTFNELKKRDVINVADGRCLGRMLDLRLSFPQGNLIGIVVPGRKVKGLLRCFDRSEIYIDESRIIKIGGDVILVDINCSDAYSQTVKPSGSRHKPAPSPPCPPPCPPQCAPCPPQCPPPCPPQCRPNASQTDNLPDFNVLSGGNGRIDTGDY